MEWYYFISVQFVLAFRCTNTQFRVELSTHRLHFQLRWDDLCPCPWCWLNRQSLPAHVGRWNGSSTVCAAFLWMVGFSSLRKSGTYLGLNSKSHLECMIRLQLAQLFLLTQCRVLRLSRRSLSPRHTPVLRGAKIWFGLVLLLSHARPFAVSLGTCRYPFSLSSTSSSGDISRFPFNWDKIHIA